MTTSVSQMTVGELSNIINNYPKTAENKKLIAECKKTRDSFWDVYFKKVDRRLIKAFGPGPKKDGTW